jgi:hypothetical protein
MAAATPYHHDRRVAERRQIAYPAPRRPAAEGVRVSWGGIWGGVIAAMGVLLILSAIGLAVGITAAEPGTSGARALGAGAGIWAAAALLVALFTGGMVATRIGATYDPGTGFWEGFLVWTVSVLLMGVLAASGIGMGAMAGLDGANMSFSQENVGAAWISVGGLLLSLLAAVLGAMSGRRD